NMRRLPSSASSSDSAISGRWPVPSASLTIGERSGPSIRRFAGWPAQDTSEHDSWICTHPRGQLHLDYLEVRPDMRSSAAHLVACSNVIGSSVLSGAPVSKDTFL